MDRLKPCPFCGTKVEMIRKPLWDGSHGYQGCYDFKVICEKCGCTLNYSYADTVYRTEEEAINNVINTWNERKNETVATLKPKPGHWEWIQYDSNPNIGNWHCSECRAIILHMPEETDNTPIYKWCPMCGAKMVEPQERSE